VIEFELTIGK